MKISIKNLGPLKNAEFQLKKLTLICGENNSGKTYATYAMFGFLFFWDKIFNKPWDPKEVDKLFENGAIRIDFDQLLESRAAMLQEASEAFSNFLPRVFAAKSKNFANAKVEIFLDDPNSFPEEKQKFERQFGSPQKQILRISKEPDNGYVEVSLLEKSGQIEMPKETVAIAVGSAIREILFSHLLPKPFIASAERTGAAIFRKELNFARNRLLEEVHAMDDNSNPFDLIFKAYSDYPIPVREDVDFIRKLEGISKEDGYIAKEHPEILNAFKDIIGGEYKVTKNDELFFVPSSRRSVKLNMDESSSAVRSLLNVGFYLRHIAKQGDLLIIDEPELNLHPRNQRRIARLIAQLVNVGLKVFITTHSDYIVKELSLLLMLNSENKYLETIAKDEGYHKNEFLISNDIGLYITKPSRNQFKFETAKITQENGIEAESFDTTIDEMNKVFDAIIWGDDN